MDIDAWYADIIAHKFAEQYFSGRSTYSNAEIEKVNSGLGIFVESEALTIS